MANPKKRWWLVLLLFIPVILAAGFVGWAITGPAPMPEALDALQTDDRVLVETEPWLVFRPAGKEATTGLVLYPGGRVDPRAYAPAARALAAEGYLVVIVPMPLDLAVLGSRRAADVLAAYPSVQRWAVGGHSLGGAMAARFASENPDTVDGLVLWASYPASGTDLSAQDIQVTSVYATLDGVATEDEVASSRPLLPPETEWVPIQGGNHAQFGWYGTQEGDRPAAISRLEQQDQVVAATIGLLQRMGGPAP